MLIFLIALVVLILFYVIYIEMMFTSIGKIAQILSSIASWVVFISVSDRDKNVIRNIPNFDEEIFLKCICS